MGKKQKQMKKAAAAAAAATAASTKAAATAAAKAAAALEKVGINNNNNNDFDDASLGENGEYGGGKQDLREMRANVHKLMNLAKSMKSKPCTSRKNQGSSSASVSSESDNSEDSDDAVTVVQQAVKPGAETGTGGGAGSGTEAGAEAMDIPEFVPIPKCSRGEKKARRLLMKLDLEKVTNVSRVTMRKAKNVLLCIDQPEVYKCPNTKTLICFGEVRVEDTSNAAAAQAAERYLNDANVRSSPQSKDGDQQDEFKIDNDDDDDDNDVGNLDDSQLDEKDIELVQMQAECSRQKAIKALLKHKSDVVNAIMELTVG